MRIAIEDPSGGHSQGSDAPAGDTMTGMDVRSGPDLSLHDLTGLDPTAYRMSTAFAAGHHGSKVPEGRNDRCPAGDVVREEGTGGSVFGLDLARPAPSSRPRSAE